MDFLPGDIILYPVAKGVWWLDRAIGAAQMLIGYTGQQYCHCAIFAGGNLDYEARWPKTGLYRMDVSRPYEVWRPNGITDFKRQELMYSCKLHNGEWYDVVALLTAGLLQPFHLPVCSSYVAARFNEVGLCKADKFDVPDQILELIPSTMIANGGVQ